MVRTIKKPSAPKQTPGQPNKNKARKLWQLFGFLKTLKESETLNRFILGIAAKPVEDGGYCCGLCSLQFRSWNHRNFHEWKDHPGCKKYRVERFKDYTCYHSCMCRFDQNDLNRCDECNGFKGAYR